MPGDQLFKSACAPLNFNGPVPLAFVATPFGQGIEINYQATPQTYAIQAEGSLLTFGPADRDASAPSNIKAYQKGPNNADRFQLARPIINGTGLDYGRSATLMTTRFGSRITYACVIGVQTLVTDVPAATTVSFTQIGVGATAYDASSGSVVIYSLAKTPVTFTVNLTTLKVDLSMRLVGTPAGGGADVNLGTVTGTGTLNADTGSFEGQFASTDREANGSFGGTFFGPQRREFGFAYGFSGRNSSAQLVFSSGGTVLGTR